MYTFFQKEGAFTSNSDKIIMKKSKCLNMERFNRNTFQQQSISQTFALLLNLFLRFFLAAGTLFSCPDRRNKCYLVACRVDYFLHFVLDLRFFDSEPYLAAKKLTIILFFR